VSHQKVFCFLNNFEQIEFKQEKEENLLKSSLCTRFELLIQVVFKENYLNRVKFLFQNHVASKFFFQLKKE